MDLLKLYNDSETVIVQDDVEITAGELNRLSNNIAGYILDNFKDEEIIGVISDNNVYGLILAVGVALAGKNVLPLSTINSGITNDYLISQTNCNAFVGYGTDLDHSDIKNITSIKDFTSDKTPGSFVVSSTGSTGIPKVNVDNALRLSTDHIYGELNLIYSKMPGVNKKVFYSAPLMSGLTVYLSMIAIKIIPYLTNKIPSTELMHEIISKNEIDICTGRPTIIERFINQGLDSMAGAKVLISSGAPLAEKHIDYCRDKLGIKHMLDFYSTTESGTLAVRDAIYENKFSLYPHVYIFDVSQDGFKVTTDYVNGYYKDGIFYKSSYRFVDDVVEHIGNKIMPLGRIVRKSKVNGFSISPVFIKEAFVRIKGVIDCNVKIKQTQASSDIITVEYTGVEYSSSDIIKELSNSLPFYSIPKEIKYIPLEKWGLTK